MLMDTKFSTRQSEVIRAILGRNRPQPVEHTTGPTGHVKEMTFIIGMQAG